MKRSYSNSLDDTVFSNLQQFLNSVPVCVISGGNNKSDKSAYLNKYCQNVSKCRCRCKY